MTRAARDGEEVVMGWGWSDKILAEKAGERERWFCTNGDEWRRMGTGRNVQHPTVNVQFPEGSGMVHSSLRWLCFAGRGGGVWGGIFVFGVETGFWGGFEWLCFSSMYCSR